MQLLQKFSITAAGKREKLLRVIKNPVNRYLPVNSRKIGEVMLYDFSCVIYFILEMKLIFALIPGLSFSSEKLVNINNYVGSAGTGDVDLVFVVSSK